MKLEEKLYWNTNEQQDENEHKNYWSTDNPQIADEDDPCINRNIWSA